MHVLLIIHKMFRGEHITIPTEDRHRILLFHISIQLCNVLSLCYWHIDCGHIIKYTPKSSDESNHRGLGRHPVTIMCMRCVSVGEGPDGGKED